MNIVEVKITDLKPYENNPRNNDAAVKPVTESIRQFGFKVPIVIDKNNTIVCGHTRYKAAKRLKIKTVPCVIADDLTEAQVRAFRLADNKTVEFAEWDDELLDIELETLQELDGIDLEPFEFEFSGGGGGTDYDNIEESRENLMDRFIVPPYSVFSTAQGYWQKRKAAWHKIIDSGQGREDGLTGQGLLQLAQKTGTNLTGTSIFDPVLCEVLLNWFCPQGGKIIDPFAGGSVRGLVSVMLGNRYTGVDLSKKQIDANYDNYKVLKGCKDLFGKDLKEPHWINGDSLEIDTLVSDNDYDFMLTCPPYADLEVYSDDPRDISNMDYKHFLTAYRVILQKTAAKLKPDAYAAIVVGEVRDKNGYYYNFVGDTVQAMLDAGLKYYNECILATQIATASIRAGRQFDALRKVAKVHQNVLIFIKGDEHELRNSLKMYDYDFQSEEELKE